jgi:hypothetical protein
MQKVLILNSDDDWKLFEKDECNWQGIFCYEQNVSAILLSEYDMQLIHPKLVQFAHDAIWSFT